MHEYRKDFSKVAGTNLKKNSVINAKNKELEMFPVNVQGVKYKSPNNKKEVDFNPHKYMLRLLAFGVAGALAISGMINYFEWLYKRDTDLINNADNILSQFADFFEQKPNATTDQEFTIEGDKSK